VSSRDPHARPQHRGPDSSEPYLRRLRGMMVIAGDVAINGRASGSSWSLRGYPPGTKRRDAVGSRYASPMLNIQYVASATAPIALAWPLRGAPRPYGRRRGGAGGPPRGGQSAFAASRRPHLRGRFTPGRGGPNQLSPPLAWTRGVVPA